MSNQTLISIIIGVVTLVLSIGSSALMIGIRFGRMESDVRNMQTDIAEIKGMFRLTLKE